MKKLFLASTFLAAVVAVAALLATSPVLAVTTTQHFVQTVPVANQFEIASSELALTNSQNPRVREFAQKMIDDHTKAGENFKAALASSNADATVPDGLDPKHQRIMDKLNAATPGRDFDRQYIKAQVNAHKEAVSLFRNYSKHGDDLALQKFASQTLPALEKHLKHIKRLNAGV